MNIEREGSPLLAGIKDRSWMYFVHSYAVETEPDLVAATCEYGIDVTAMVEKDSLWATQFHPEKSGELGRIFAENFYAQVLAQ